MQNSRLVIFDKVPFENSYENVISFPNINELKDFMLFNKDLFNIIYDKAEMNYIKEHERQINISGKSEDFKNASYLFFENENITMFAFIVGYEYVNKGTLTGTTTLHYEIDVWNTYQFQLKKTKAKGFIEQQTIKNFKEVELNGEIKKVPNIIDRQQNYNTGTKLLREFEIVDTKIHWIVIVSKPSIKIGKKEQSALGSNVGTYKATKYFIFPVNKNISQVYPFEIFGKSYKGGSARQIIYLLTNSFDTDGSNTVNQTVFAYSTKFLGIDYEFDGTTVKIKNSKDDLWARVLDLTTGEETGNSNSGGSGGGSTGGNTTGDYNKGEITNGEWHISQSDINKMVNGFRKVGVKTNYNFVLAQMWLESNWGNPSVSTVATVDNNWSGISMPFSIPEKYGVSISNGTQRAEGGYYVHFNSLDDFMVAYAYVLSLENGLYNIDGKSTIEDYCKGLFRVGGASSDYAASGYEHYYSLLIPTYNAIVSNNSEQCKQLESISPKL